MKRLVAAAAAVGAQVLLLTGCGGGSVTTDLSAVDPIFRDAIESPTSCAGLQSIADAQYAKVEAFEHGTDSYETAYATFMAAGDVLREMGCPGW